MKKPDLEDIAAFIGPYRVTDGKGFRLDEHDPSSTGSLTKEDKDDAQQALKSGVEWLAEEQAKLYAQDQWALLLVFQARDAAGKDSTIKHVMSGVNPQGCVVTSFKQPSREELDHDFLWRHHAHIPARGQIGIFNRSYYEDVLVVRVHDELLAGQKLHPSLIDGQFWRKRLDDINNFERYLSHNGVTLVKFFLNVSKEEQKQRFLERLDRPEKHWKFDDSDVLERRFWDDYTVAYEAAIRATATDHAPWYVVPADKKWFTRLVVAAVTVDAMARLGVDYPKIDAERRRELDAARKGLLGE